MTTKIFQKSIADIYSPSLFIASRAFAEKYNRRRINRYSADGHVSNFPLFVLGQTIVANRPAHLRFADLLFQTQRGNGGNSSFILAFRRSGPTSCYVVAVGRAL